MDKTIFLSLVLNAASLMLAFYVYRVYRKASDYLRTAEEAAKEAFKNLHESAIHLKKCRRLSAEMQAKGEKLWRK